jgi:hypothetical protein
MSHEKQMPIPVSWIKIRIARDLKVQHTLVRSSQKK